MQTKSGLEIERRFLLKNLSSATKPFHVNSSYITQLYLPTVDDVTRRVREEGALPDDNGVTHITYTEKKEVSPGVREETESVITVEQFEQYLKETDRVIVKNRHRFQFPETGDLIWEIDVFQNINLIIAEIELPSVDHNIEIPTILAESIVIEVTHLPEFSNSSLALPVPPGMF